MSEQFISIPLGWSVFRDSTTFFLSQSHMTLLVVLKMIILVLVRRKFHSEIEKKKRRACKGFQQDTKHDTKGKTKKMKKGS